LLAVGQEGKERPLFSSPNGDCWGKGGGGPVCCSGKKSLLYHSVTNTDYPRGKLLSFRQEGKGGERNPLFCSPTIYTENCWGRLVLPSGGEENPLFSFPTTLGIAGGGGTVFRRGKKTRYSAPPLHWELLGEGVLSAGGEINHLHMHPCLLTLVARKLLGGGGAVCRRGKITYIHPRLLTQSTPRELRWGDGSVCRKGKKRHLPHLSTLITPRELLWGDGSVCRKGKKRHLPHLSTLFTPRELRWGGGFLQEGKITHLPPPPSTNYPKGTERALLPSPTPTNTDYPKGIVGWGGGGSMLHEERNEKFDSLQTIHPTLFA
jgi:hypothetical protein